jgi:hypothetical protein
MQEWLERKEEFLDAILQRETPANNARTCNNCTHRDASWRCLDCNCLPMYCNECIQKTHQILPLHRVEYWDGDHYTPAWLAQAGVKLFTGHFGHPCPLSEHRGPTSGVRSNNWEDSIAQTNNSNEPLDPFDDPWRNVDSDDEPNDPDAQPDNPEGDVLQHCSSSCLDPLVTTGKNILIVVDSSGVHHLPVVWCKCKDDENRKDLQLLQMGYYPASFRSTRTVFTFSVLNEFLISNLECKTPAMSFYAKLRRLTSKAFPNSVPDRYRELLQVSRQWRHLKYLKWHGFAHKNTIGPGPGDLATFCVACPQPDVNLPFNWKSISDDER